MGIFPSIISTKKPQKHWNFSSMALTGTSIWCTCHIVALTRSWISWRSWTWAWTLAQRIYLLHERQEVPEFLWDLTEGGRNKEICERYMLRLFSSFLLYSSDVRFYSKATRALWNCGISPWTWVFAPRTFTVLGKRTVECSYILWRFIVLWWKKYSHWAFNWESGAESGAAQKIKKDLLNHV